MVVIARKHQLTDITRSIKEIDSGAFITVEIIHAVYGQGFEEIKTGIGVKHKSKEDYKYEK